MFVFMNINSYVTFIFINSHVTLKHGGYYNYNYSMSPFYTFRIENDCYNKQHIRSILRYLAVSHW